MGSPALFSLYVKNIPIAIHHDNLAVCVNYTSVLATSHNLYCPSIISEGSTHWVRDWRTAVRISKNITLLFGVKAKHS